MQGMGSSFDFFQSNDSMNIPLPQFPSLFLKGADIISNRTTPHDDGYSNRILMTPSSFECQINASDILTSFAQPNGLVLSNTTLGNDEASLDLAEPMDSCNAEADFVPNIADGDDHTTPTIDPAEIHLSTVCLSSMNPLLSPDLDPRSISPSMSRVPRPPAKRKRSTRYDTVPQNQVASRRSKIGVMESLQDPNTTQTDKMPEQGDIVSNLCSSVASATSMIQLKAMISAMRRSDQWDMRFHAVTAIKIFQALDRLETVQQSCALWRRILLYRLAKHRDQLLETIRKHRLPGSRTRVSQRLGKPESEVIDVLMKEIHPHTASLNNDTDTDTEIWRKRYCHERKNVSNRLHAARKWKLAVQNFQIGILALIPLGGEFSTQNYRYVGPA